MMSIITPPPPAGTIALALNVPATRWRKRTSRTVTEVPSGDRATSQNGKRAHTRNAATPGLPRAAATASRRSFFGMISSLSCNRRGQTL